MSVVSIRPLVVDDGDRLCELYRQDQDFLRRWDPERPDSFFTPLGQSESVRSILRECEADRAWAGVVLLDGVIVGRVNLNGILRGPLRSCFLGYWVAQSHSGRGVATEAVSLVLDLAFVSLGLHRVDAFAREENVASCRVLERNQFEQVGISRRHIHIDGRWRDDIYFQKLAPWDDGVRLEPPTIAGSDGCATDLD